MSRMNVPDFAAVRGRRLLVALSGGADSTALLHMLTNVRKTLNLTLFAAHIDHGIRGEAGHQDAEFCRKLCDTLGIPLNVAVLDVPREAAQSGEGLETAARRLRYECLRRFKIERSAEYIVLAHHLDDQAETVLMHLLRGCGPGGIGGMAAFSQDLYRPLLSVPKRALEAWLEERGLSWRVDATNLLPCTPRNALRLHGLPALEESYPQAASAIARYAETARCEDAFLTRMMQTFLDDHFDRGPYGVRLRNPELADEAILRRCLRLIVGTELSHERLLELTALCRKTRGKIALPGGQLAQRVPGAIYFLPKSPFLPEPKPLPWEGAVTLERIGQMEVQPWESAPVRNDPYRQVLCKKALSGAVLRTRRAGDRMRPLGCGDRLLSDVLTDRKLDQPLRDVLPLVAVGNRILWAVGVGIAEEAKLRSCEDEAVLLTWRGDRSICNSDGFTSDK